MAISYRKNVKKMNLYTLFQPQLKLGDIVWPKLCDYEEVEVNSVANSIMIARASFIEKKEEEEVLSNVLQNNYGIDSLLCGHNPCSL